MPQVRSAHLSPHHALLIFLALLLAWTTLSLADAADRPWEVIQECRGAELLGFVHPVGQKHPVFYLNCVAPKGVKHRASSVLSPHFYGTGPLRVVPMSDICDMPTKTVRRGDKPYKKKCMTDESRRIRLIVRPKR